MTTNKIFGRRIKERRLELGISAEDLAERIGAVRSTIYRYEQGICKTLKLSVIEKISNELKVNPEWLVGKSDVKFVSEIKEPTDVTVEEIYNYVKYQLYYSGDVTLNEIPISSKEAKVILQALRLGIKMVKDDRAVF